MVSWNSYKDCHGLATWFVILDYCIMISFLLILLCLAVWSFFRVCKVWNTKLRHSDMPLKCLVLYSLSIFLFIIDAITVNYTNYMWVEHCQTNTEFDTNSSLLIMTMIMVISTITALALMESLFALRLIIVFNGSVLQVSTTLRNYLYFVSISQIIFSFIIWMAYLVDRNDTSLVSLFAAIILLSYIFNSIFMTIVFGKKLNQVAAIANQSKISNDFEDDTLTLTREIGSKVIVCVFFALSSTCILVIFAIILSFISNDYVSVILRILILSDSIVNSICLTLQWNFSHDIYSKYCVKCHRCVKKMYTNDESTTVAHLSDIDL